MQPTPDSRDIIEVYPLVLNPSVHPMNAAVSITVAERLAELGNIPADRIRLSPAPGSATVDDLIHANSHSSPLCELVDQTLVEKAVGYESSVVALTIASILRTFVKPQKLLPRLGVE